MRWVLFVRKSDCPTSRRMPTACGRITSWCCRDSNRELHAAGCLAVRRKRGRWWSRSLTVAVAQLSTWPTAAISQSPHTAMAIMNHTESWSLRRGCCGCHRSTGLCDPPGVLWQGLPTLDVRADAPPGRARTESAGRVSNPGQNMSRNSGVPDLNLVAAQDSRAVCGHSGFHFHGFQDNHRLAI